MKRLPHTEESKLLMSEAQQKFEPQTIIDALTRNHGYIGRTAKDLNCATRTVNRYINTYPEVKEALADIIETQGDKAEQKLFDLIDSGNPAAVMFYLRTKLRHRGYSERVSVEIVPYELQQKLQELCAKKGVSINDLLNHIIDELTVDDSDVITLERLPDEVGRNFADVGVVYSSRNDSDPVDGSVD